LGAGTWPAVAHPLGAWEGARHLRRPGDCPGRLGHLPTL